MAQPLANPVPSPGEYAQLLKLFTAIVRKQGGRIELPASDLFDAEPPKGISQRWDNSSRCLVIELIEHGTSLFITDGGPLWSPATSSSQQPLQQSAQPKQQPTLLVPEHLRTLLSLEQEPLLQPMASPSSQQPRSAIPFQTHAVVDDERALQLESDRRKRAAIQQIESWESPEAALARERAEQRQHPHSQPSSMPSQPSQSSRLQETFFKT